MKKNFLLFDNTEYYNNHNAVKAELEEMYHGLTIDDYMVYDELGRIEQDDWDTMKSIMKGVDNRYCGWLVVGTNGRWNGTYKGGFVADDFDEVLTRTCADCEYIKVYTDKWGRLFIEATHHDGTNFVQVLPLTEAGRDLYDTWSSCTIPYYHHDKPTRYKMEYDSYSDSQIHEVLLHKVYSRKAVVIPA